MTTDWMLDVLEDLRAFAGANGMVQLEQQLEITADVAAREGALLTLHAQGQARGDAVTNAGRIHRTA